MYLKPNKVEEYKKRHDKIWPELRHLLKEAELVNISFPRSWNRLSVRLSGKRGKGLSVNGWKSHSPKMVGIHERPYGNSSDLSQKQLNLNQVFSLWWTERSNSYFHLIFWSCDQKSDTQNPPNIILIVTDDQRWDAIGYAGNEIIITPEQDQLAKEGTISTRLL